ncbi:hypothetical protein [Clostridium felsineum]|nr:hypothetical protein [Clostridium felsineum]
MFRHNLGSAGQMKHIRINDWCIRTNSFSRIDIERKIYNNKKVV